MKTPNGRCKWLLICSSLALVWMTGCLDEHRSTTRPVPGQHVEELTRTVDASDALRLIARTTNGTIEVTGGDGDSARVRIVLTVRASSTSEAAAFARDIELDVVRDGDQVFVYQVYPRPPDDIEVRVDYEIECPRDLDLQLDTDNGPIRTSGTTAAVKATTINGNIDLIASGGPFNLGVTNGIIGATIDQLGESAEFTAVNGNLQVEILDGVALLRLAVVNGSVALTLPAAFGGQLDARNTVGSISCGLPLGGSHGSTPHHVWGTIGSGGTAPVILRAVVGNIEVR